MTPIDTSFHLLRIIGMKSDAVSWTIGNSVKKWRSRPKKNRIIVRARACPFSTARALASALGCAPAAVGTLKHRMPWQQSLRLTGCCLLHRALTKITKSDTEGEESPGSVPSRRTRNKNSVQTALSQSAPTEELLAVLGAHQTPTSLGYIREPEASCKWPPQECNKSRKRQRRRK